MLHRTSGREHGLDVLRASAILGTLAFHSADLPGAPATLARVFGFGWLGVDLFFVLSGFLIARQVFKDRSRASYGRRLSLFWKRRAFRTLPLYAIVLFCYVVVKPRLFHAPFQERPWHYLVFLQNYTMHGPSTVDFVASWSLCVEEHFYLVFPLIAFALVGRERLPPWAWLLALFASAVVRFVAALPLDQANRYVAFTSTLHWATHSHLDGLSVGVTLAAYETRWRAWSQRARKLSFFSGLVVLLGTCSAFGAMTASIAGIVLYFMFAAFAFAMILVGTSELTVHPRVYAVVRPIAIWSYGAYLWFGLVLRAVDRFVGASVTWPVLVLAFVGTTFAIAWLTYEWIERPAIRLRDILLRGL